METPVRVEIKKAGGSLTRRESRKIIYTVQCLLKVLRKVEGSTREVVHRNGLVEVVWNPK